MAQHSNGHLTITELSAYLDKELTPEELALCDAHIQTCQPCQAALADLRLTSALLSSLPQVAVPRSFVLPANLALLPETPPATTKTSSGRSSTLAPVILQRTIRALSTLAAVLGLFFILAGVVSVLPRSYVTSGAANSSAAPSNGNPSLQHTASDATSRAIASGTAGQERTPHASSTFSGTATSAPNPAPTPTLAPTQTYGINQGTQPREPAPAPELPAVLNPGQTEGRLTIGSALLLLGIVGAVTSRLFGHRARRTPRV